MKFGVLTSGSLGFITLLKIIRDFNVLFVLTDNNSEDIVSLCNEYNIPYYKGNPRGGFGYSFIKDIEVDIIVSINYLFLIEKDIINHPKQLIFNLHGSLLPKYRGRTPHVWSIINNEKETGITAHVIDEGCDTGDIISQITITIEKYHSGNDLLNIFKIKYFDLFKDVVKKVVSGKLDLKEQDEELATYFGLRNPNDGLIDWSWQKDRIINWVRALSYPYPGAFTFLNGNKLTIDEVEESSLGFNSNLINGTVICVFPNIIVKTQNGSLIIKNYREKVQFVLGEILTKNEK